MERYDSYKDSGVEWIGEIPSEWIVSKFKFDTLNPVQYGINISSDKYVDEGIRFVRITDINEDGSLNTNNGRYLISDDVPEEFLLNKYDVLFCRSGHTVGKSYFHTTEGQFTSGGYLVRFNFRNYTESKFVFYLSKTNFYWDWIKLNTVVSTIENVNGDKYQNFIYPKPPLSEQQQIVSFLDIKTSLIDSLIEKTQRKIELLKDSIPNYHFYTNEKNQFIEMKKYWFQKKPSKWRVLKLREIFDIISERNHPNERLLSVHQIKGVIYRDEQSQDVMNPFGDTSNYKLVNPGDFIISLRSSEGGFEYSEVTGLVSPVYTVLRPKFEIDTVFYKYLFKTHNFIVELNRFIKGIRDGKNINFIDIRDVLVPVPLEFNYKVHQNHLNILKSFSLEEKRIELLKEYRQSLISEVVTGKRKVV
jgi:type I restriction enzyme, S subunit